MGATENYETIKDEINVFAARSRKSSSRANKCSYKTEVYAALAFSFFSLVRCLRVSLLAVRNHLMGYFQSFFAELSCSFSTLNASCADHYKALLNGPRESGVHKRGKTIHLISQRTERVRPFSPLGKKRQIGGCLA